MAVCSWREASIQVGGVVVVVEGSGDDNDGDDNIGYWRSACGLDSDEADAMRAAAASE